jgi:hypothetical protein
MNVVSVVIFAGIVVLFVASAVNIFDCIAGIAADVVGVVHIDIVVGMVSVVSVANNIVLFVDSAVDILEIAVVGLLWSAFLHASCKIIWLNLKYGIQTFQAVVASKRSRQW